MTPQAIFVPALPAGWVRKSSGPLWMTTVRPMMSLTWKRSVSTASQARPSRDSRAGAADLPRGRDGGLLRCHNGLWCQQRLRRYRLFPHGCADRKAFLILGTRRIILAVRFLRCKNQMMRHFLAPSGQPEMTRKTSCALGLAYFRGARLCA